MTLKKIILFVIIATSLYSCADYTKNKNIKSTVKQYYSSSGFALIYYEDLYKQKILNKKITNNDDIKVMHSLLKKNTPVKIINPVNSKSIETKIYKRSNYPKIFNIVISKKVADILELDLDNPFIEIIEVKKNKTFIAKKANTFEEERNVAEKAPVSEIKMDDLTNKISDKKEEKTTLFKNFNFFIILNDFYYENSAINLKNELIKKTKLDSISVIKVTNTKYRLLAGPFKNFNALKTTYISLNNSGFEDLNIYKE